MVIEPLFWVSLGLILFGSIGLFILSLRKPKDKIKLPDGTWIEW